MASGLLDMYLRESPIHAACRRRPGGEELLQAGQPLADGPQHDGRREHVSILLCIYIP